MKFNKYASQVVGHIPTNAKTRRRIKEDIVNQLEEMGLREGFDDPVEAMGDPITVAAEFTDNLDIQPNILSKRFEYRSGIEIMGLPLIHITNDRKIAKGIIAIGGFSVGIIAIGGGSVGIISLGGFSFGLLFALGGLSISLGMAIGGLAVSYLAAIGGVAISKVIAIGGGAWARDIAIGDFASAKVCGYFTNFEGDVGIDLAKNRGDLLPTVKEYFPDLSSFYYWLVELASNIREGTLKYNGVK